MIKTATLTLVFASFACAGGFSLGAGDTAPSNESESKPVPTAEGDGDYTLAQKKFIKSANERFQPYVESLNKRCGTNIDGAIDWKSWIAEVDGQIKKTKPRTSIYGRCVEPLTVLTYTCRDDDDAKAVIASKVASYHCKFGGEGKRSMKLTKKNLAMWVDLKSVNNRDFIKEWLGNNL